jgi:hypothetical protein
MATDELQPYSVATRVLVALAFAGALGGLVYYAYFTGAQLGAPCANDADCDSSYCLHMSGGGECTVRCDRDAQCPKPLTCESTPVEFSRGPVPEGHADVRLCRTPWARP